MSAPADLVMPKLGLTMTEGRVASWSVRPGQTFAAGDVLVVVETDKIANEVEAPAAGTLVEILAAEDSVVPVGAPIARWEPGEGAAAPAGETVTAASPAPAAEAARQVSPAPTAARDSAPRQDGERVVATPYARRLAREAGLDLTGLPGSGPRGRIKAADVEAALASRLAGPAPAEASAVAPVAGVSGVAPAARPASFAVAEIDAAPLAGLVADLHRAGHAGLARRHLIALACVRLLAGEGRAAMRLALDDDEGRVAIEADAGISLSGIAGQLARASGNGGGAEPGGDIIIHVAPQGLRFFGPAAASGWTMTLGLTEGPGGTDTGEPGTIGAVLSYDSGTLDHAAAARFLSGLKALLESPLRLLVG